jgi:hypothetical protein
MRRPSHLHSVRSQEWCSVPAVWMGYYEKVANQGRRYPQLAESRHADAEKMRVTVKNQGLAKLQPYKHRRLKRQCTSSASERSIRIDLLCRETLSGPARRRRLRYGCIDGFLEPCWPREAAFGELAIEYHPELRACQCSVQPLPIVHTLSDALHDGIRIWLQWPAVISLFDAPIAVPGFAEAISLELPSSRSNAKLCQ